MYSGFGPPRPSQTTRMSGFRGAVHAGNPPRRSHGLFRRRMRGLLSLSQNPPGQGGNVNLACPLPSSSEDEERILLAHGGGGRLTQQLIDRIFRPAFDNP